jgi:hypothetical protein
MENRFTTLISLSIQSKQKSHLPFLPRVPLLPATSISTESIQNLLVSQHHQQQSEFVPTSTAISTPPSNQSSIPEIHNISELAIKSPTISKQTTPHPSLNLSNSRSMDTSPDLRNSDVSPVSPQANGTTSPNFSDQLEAVRQAAIESRRRAGAQAIVPHVQQLKQRIDKDKLDSKAWLEYLRELENKGDLEKCREGFEGFLTIWPEAVGGHSSN